MIAAKRYPNEVEIEDLISDLQKNHVFVYILSSDTPSGGSSPSAMFNLATRTNGYCVFSTEDYLNVVLLNAQSINITPNLIAAQKNVVFGKGSLTIPFKTFVYPGNKDDVDYKIIFQDHKVDESLKSLNYTVTDELGNKWSYTDYLNTQYTAYFDWVRVNKTVQYYLNIDYEYDEGRQEVMVVRIYSYSYVPDNWLPFNN